MRVHRFGTLAAAAGLVLLSGCASGGGGASGGADFGDEPRENVHTRSAELFLVQAAGDPSRYQDALDAALMSIAEDSSNATGYFQAARARLGLDDVVGADTMFDAALAMYSGYETEIRRLRESAWIELFNSAIEPLDRGDAEEGIRMLELAETIFSEQRPEALINLGVSYNNAGRVDDAIDAYARALDLIRGPRMQEVDSATAVDWAQRETNVAFNRAQLLSMEERYDEAATEYETYLESRPGDVRALSSLASVLAEVGMADSAQAIYDGLLSEAGLGLREFLNIGVGLYTAGVYDKAAQAFQEVVHVAPENRDALFNLAQSLYEAEDWETLIPVAEDLVELDGHNRDSYTILGQALARTGDDQRAVEVLSQGQDLDFRFEGGALQPRSSGGGAYSGALVNNALDAGATVTVRVHFNGEDGAEIGFVDVRVAAPAQGESESFQADLTSDETLVGYYLEVVSPR